MLDNTVLVNALVSVKKRHPPVPGDPATPVQPSIVRPAKPVGLRDANVRAEPGPSTIFEPAAVTDNWPRTSDRPVVAPVLRVPPARVTGPESARTFAAPSCK